MSDLTIEEVKQIRDAAHDAIAAFDAALNKKKEGCNMTGDYYYEQRITELEAQVEALTPKPAVKSEWLAVYPDWSKWYGKRSTALDTQISNGNFIALVRKDVITHHDGKVECKLEVEG